MCAESDARSTFICVDVERDLADALHGVGVEEHALLACTTAPISSIGLTVPISLLASMIDTTRIVLSVIAARTVLGLDAAVLVDRQVGDLEALLLEALAGVEHRLVLGLRGDDVVALVLVELGHALDREVVRLGRARREDDLLARRADQRGDLLARRLDRLLRLPAEGVDAAGGVAEHLA